MRFSELATKEIINLNNGVRLGLLGDTDLVINPETGQIEQIVVIPRGRLGKGGHTVDIPWSAVRRVGPEVLIVELEDSNVKVPRSTS